MPSRTVVYLSGPMSGRPEWNFPAFDAAADRLRGLGYRVINPADFGAAPHLKWEDCIARDLAILPCVQVVAQLPGWEDSRGARLEADVARAMGKDVVALADLVGIAELMR